MAHIKKMYGPNLAHWQISYDSNDQREREWHIPNRPTEHTRQAFAYAYTQWLWSLQLTLAVVCVWKSRMSFACDQLPMYVNQKYTGLKCRRILSA
jgi:hypothetical protein